MFSPTRPLELSQLPRGVPQPHRASSVAQNSEPGPEPEQGFTQTPSQAQQVPNSELSTWRSISIVASSFTIVFTCCGLNFAFGVYQALYEAMAQEPKTPFTGATPAQIGLIGTISISLMTMGAPFAVAWAKRFSPFLVSLVGGVIFGLSLVLASFGTRLWHFVLTQGLLLGVGTCMPYMAAATVAPTWFTSRRGLAMGIILAGTGIGGLVWAPVLKALISGFGYRNSLRISGAVSSILIAMCSTSITWEAQTQTRIHMENASREARLNGIFMVPLLDWRIAKSRKFIAHGLGAMFQAAAYYTPVFFFASYARTLGYSDAAGANFIALSNACNAIGKIVIGFGADRMGRVNALSVTTLVSAAITVGFWLPSTVYGTSNTSRDLFIAFTVLYGLFASAYVSLFPTCIVELFGVQNFASVNGVLYMVRGLATLVGTPLGGVLIRGQSGLAGPSAYMNMSVFVSVLLFTATAATLWVRLESMMGMDGRRSFKWKV
ncbi:major facilitator superfamily domain-containing protein [Stachybotrys elegans]|uniref:Major facilitator superfamily domain-containing protein n=1 Tax=Stachybotrys elegans TaxID=80388 RepID=A0A8K0SFS4_9HYPO|nr:major facilitator superfamily domain-containing protein [Stachybotrys elegans]